MIVSNHTDNFAQKSEALGSSLGKLDESYQNTAQIITNTGSNYQHMTESLSKIEAGGKSYQDQLEAMNKNLLLLMLFMNYNLKEQTNRLKMLKH